MDRCALFVDAGYALADGAMAVHGTRRRDSVSWDHAGLLKLLAGLARDRTGLPVLRCYWYETAEGRRTAEHDALAEMPGLKLRLVNARPGRREGIESQLRSDLVTLAKSGAICDAFIASADQNLAEIVAEVQDLGLRVVILHIASDGGWTIPAPLRQECDDIVEISGVHLRPFVELIRGAEPARTDDQYDSAAFSARNSDSGVIAGALTHQGLPAAALPAPSAVYQMPAGSDFRSGAQPYGPGLEPVSASAAYQVVSSAAQPAGQADPAGQYRVASVDASGPAEGAPQQGPAPAGAVPLGAVPLGVLAGAQGNAAQNAYQAAAGQSGMAPQGGSYQNGMPASTAQPAYPIGNQQNGVPSNGVAGGTGQGGYQNGGPVNGLTLPGGTSMGYQNGSVQNGTGQNGVGQNGPGQNGTGQNGPQPNGYQAGIGHHDAQVGSYLIGPGQGGPGQNGSIQNGAQTGAYSLGAGPNGHGPNGHGPNGNGQNGAGQNSQGQNGSGHNGVSAGNGLPGADQQSGAIPVGASAGFEAAPTPSQLYGPPQAGFFPGQGQLGPTQDQQPRQAFPPGHPQGAAAAYQPQPQYAGQPQSSAQVVRAAQPVAISLPEAVKAAHAEGFSFGESVGRDAPGLWLEAVLARKPRMPSDLEARLLQGSVLPIDSLLHDEVRHSLRRGFWDALEGARR